ncbi:hypothetical protein N658DRAFT_65996 [Parathielavia hyrcaniae]|uniref:Uncharacterized protein n=1 Tax=Parathielavia hyrcaniae TaxID=113614 RepID=A0AAN6SX22_9PEZI|nr:hypothetical protein N658DRAFT_65996 [Parathielavia hyrcaniae]
MMLPRAVAGDRAVNTGEHSARAGSLEDRAKPELRVMDGSKFSKALDVALPGKYTRDLYPKHGIRTTRDSKHPSV